jgi:hypothetical protein
MPAAPSQRERSEKLDSSPQASLRLQVSLRVFAHNPAFRSSLREGERAAPPPA